MKSKTGIWYALIAITAAATWFSACQKDVPNPADPNAGKKKINIVMMDNPSLDLRRVLVDIQMVEVKIEDESVTPHLEYWDTLDARPGIYDLLKLQNGVDTLLASGFIAPAGKIQKLRLTLGSRDSVQVDNVTYPLRIKGNNNKIIIDIPDVDQIDPNNFVIWIDFDAHGSVIRENNNQFELRPKLKTFSSNKTSRLRGEVKPDDANAILMAIAGGDTLIAIADDDGDFEFRGLKGNTCRLEVNGQNGYQDTVITNIALRPGDRTELPRIVLHR
jgi:Domain of unknown function (DUF4382)